MGLVEFTVTTMQGANLIGDDVFNDLAAASAIRKAVDDECSRLRFQIPFLVNTTLIPQGGQLIREAGPDRVRKVKEAGPITASQIVKKMRR